MKLFILRHGDAAREARSDSERRLTAQGERELHAILAARRAELADVTHVFVSPYVRAQQTAVIAAEYLQPSVISETSKLLIPEADPAQLLDFLERQQKAIQAVLVVSHQPLVGVFLDRLCGFEVGRYRLGTSALAAVEADVVAADLGNLKWLRQPADLLQ